MLRSNSAKTYHSWSVRVKMRYIGSIIWYKCFPKSDVHEHLLIAWFSCHTIEVKTFWGVLIWVLSNLLEGSTVLSLGWTETIKLTLLIVGWKAWSLQKLHTICKNCLSIACACVEWVPCFYKKKLKRKLYLISESCLFICIWTFFLILNRRKYYLF